MIEGISISVKLIILGIGFGGTKIILRGFIAISKHGKTI